MAPRGGGSTGLEFLSLPFVFIDILALFSQRALSDQQSALSHRPTDSSTPRPFEFLTSFFVFIDILGLFRQIQVES